ncbi:MAG: autotransporter-associated beta strand repeat-containing protein [Verrucomicrobia bacterium]|nr:autotransporter-associated beta strand repeat-containing protein [Verrucomicrobiota bacterium]
MKYRLNPFLAAASAVSIVLAGTSAQAATATKQNNGTNDLSSTASGVWSGGSGTNGSPATADVATWGAASSTGAHTVGSAVNWGSMSLSGNTAAVSITGSDITLAASGAAILTNSSQALTIGNNIVSTAGGGAAVGIGSTTNRTQISAGASITLNGNVTANGTGTANDANLMLRGANTGSSINGTLTVDGQLYKGDSGTWTLSAANSIGWVYINNGTLLGGNNGAFGTGTIYLASGGGSMTLASTDTTARSFGNKVDFSTGGFTGTANFGQTSVGTGALAFGELSLGSAVRNLAINANTSFTSVSGTTGGITKTGAGTLTLSGASLTSGTITISHSSTSTNGVVVGDASALGTGAVVVNGNQQFNASLSVNAGLTVSNALTLKRGQGGGNRAVLSLGAGSTWSGSITVDNTSASGLATIASEGATTAAASIVSGDIGYSTLGTGVTLVLRGGARFGKVGGSVSLSTGTVQILDNSQWEFSNASNTWGTLDISNAAGTVTTGAANTLAAAGNVSSSVGGTLQLNNQAGTTAYNQTIAGLAGTVKVGLATGSATLTLATAANQSSSGAISNAISLVKSGSATQTLSGVNTYTGTTTIKAGTLKLEGAGSIDSSASITVGDAGSSGAILDVTAKTADFTVGSSQTLGGIGTLNAAGKKVIVNGSISPGNSAGVLSVSTTNAADGLSFGSTGSLNIEMSRGVAPNAGSNYDQLGLTGGLTIASGADLNLTALGSGSWALNDIYFLIANDGADAITGAFDGFAEGGIVTFDSQQFKATYQADSGSNSFIGGNDFALQVIPEPSAILIGAVGSLALFRRRRA